MTNNLPLIYNKISNLCLSENFESDFGYLCSLIDENIKAGNFWIGLYSYYNLFNKMLLFANQDVFIPKYIYILERTEEILQKLCCNYEHIVELISNNPYEKKEFIERLNKTLDSSNYGIVFEKIRRLSNRIYESLASLIPNKNQVNYLFNQLSLYNFLKLCKVLVGSNQLDQEVVVQMVLNSISQDDRIQITEKISDVIAFGITFSDIEFVRLMVQKLLVGFILKISEYCQDSASKAAFVVSNYENIARYFRMVNNYELSSVIYLLAAIENWFQDNFGYCAKCLYKISRMVSNYSVRHILVNLAISIANLETCFYSEILGWKKEIIQIQFTKSDLEKTLSYIAFHIDPSTELIHILNSKLFKFIDSIVFKIKISNEK
ncbi:MAG: hypothetical protein ABDH21_03605 [bacterium]